MSGATAFRRNRCQYSDVGCRDHQRKAEGLRNLHLSRRPRLLLRRARKLRRRVSQARMAAYARLSLQEYEIAGIAGNSVVMAGTSGRDDAPRGIARCIPDSAHCSKLSRRWAAVQIAEAPQAG